MKKKIALLMAAIMLFGATVGGTIAWLTAETTEVKNTFTVGNVKIDLDETDVDDTDADGNVTERDKVNEYHLIPGKTYVKDPVVHVKAGSEDCFLFVEVVNNLGAAEAESDIDYERIQKQMIDNNWALLEGNIWYLSDGYGTIISVDVPSEDDLHYPVFKEFKVLETAIGGVSSNANSDSDSSVYLGYYAGKTITIKAYAIQSEGLTNLEPDEIWAKFKL